MVAAPPTSSAAGSLLHRPSSSEQGHAAAGGTSRDHRHSSAVASARCCFGPSAPAMELRPRSSCNGNNHNGEEQEEGRDGLSSHGEIEALRPQTGMTIRLTPELLGRLKEPGPKPRTELVLKSAEEGRCVQQRPIILQPISPPHCVVHVHTSLGCVRHPLQAIVAVRVFLGKRAPCLPDVYCTCGQTRVECFCRSELPNCRTRRVL